MKYSSLSKRFSCLLSLFSLLLCTGCSDVYLSNPLNVVQNDAVVGRWLDDKGKLAIVIERGSGNAYNSWSGDDFKQGKAPNQFYVSDVGGMLFTEQQANCTGHKFEAPGDTEAPKGCWAITRIVVSGSTINYFELDAMSLVRQSIAGALEVANSYGVVSSKSSSQNSAQIILRGSTGELTAFLARHKLSYSSPTTYYR